MVLSRAYFPKQLGRARARARTGFGITPRTQSGIAPRARISERLVEVLYPTRALGNLVTSGPSINSLTH